MTLLGHLPRTRPFICQRCVRNQRGVSRASQRAVWAAAGPDRDSQWREQAGRIRSGAQKSMLTVLEERGFVKDVAGGRKALDWLLTEKPIGAYVGVDPTAPSLHVGHLLPLMALYWMYLHGFYSVTLLGGGTVQIGDPSGRLTARTRQTKDAQYLNSVSMLQQLKQLGVNVKALGIKHMFPRETSRRRDVLNNFKWLRHLTAVDLMKYLGSGMRLGTMLSRDSVKMRMESGDGMAISEFCYPLFQGYDWWHMYSQYGVQMQLGGSDQYGNICAGMDAVDHMRKVYQNESEVEVQEDPLKATFGLTTPLLTTASGEKFGKSAGNAVWLDPEMLSSFDLYQYFLRTADDDVERYLKLFTFLPLDSIYLVMEHQRQDASRRTAQHLLAKEVVELAHGAFAAQNAERAHKAAFSHGTNLYSLGALRKALQDDSPSKSTNNNDFTILSVEKKRAQDLAEKIVAYKKSYASSSGGPGTVTEKPPQVVTSHSVVILPKGLLQRGTFPQVLYAAGLVSSKSEAHRLVKSKGAYVVLPNSGTPEDPHSLKWQPIPGASQDVDPNHYLVDFEALVLRTGKSKIQICRVIPTDRFEADGHTCPGWGDFKDKHAEHAEQ